MTYVRDFLGTYIKRGDYVAYPGKRNRRAEYGMILLRVVSVEDDVEHSGHGKVLCERLYVKHSPKTEAYRKQLTITNTNKLVVVDTPRSDIQYWFNTSNFTEQDAHSIARWLYGKDKAF